MGNTFGTTSIDEGNVPNNQESGTLIVDEGPETALPESLLPYVISTSIVSNNEVHASMKDIDCGKRPTQEVPYNTKQMEEAYKSIHPEFTRVPKNYPRKRAFFCEKLKQDKFPYPYTTALWKVPITFVPQKWDVHVKPCMQLSCRHTDIDMKLVDLERAWIQAGGSAEQIRKDWPKFQKSVRARTLRQQHGDVRKSDLYCYYLRKGGRRIKDNASFQEKQLHEIQKKFCGILQEDLESLDLRRKLTKARFEELLKVDDPEMFQQYIKEIFIAFKLPEVTPQMLDYLRSKGDTGCPDSTIPNILAFLEYQNFARYYFTPNNLLKGLLLWWGVGRGKTCAADAVLSYGFGKGYNVLWITRKSLTMAPLKNMFRNVCTKRIRDLLNSGTVDGEALRQRLENLDQDKKQSGAAKEEHMASLFREYIGKDWVGATSNAKSLAKSFDHRVLTYKQFQNFCRDPNTIGKWTTDMQLPTGRPKDRLRKTIIVIDEAHNLYNTSDLSQEEIFMDKNKVPIVDDIEQAIWYSYDCSKEESCKVLLMTGTPILADGEPTSLFKLLNLMKKPERISGGECQKQSQYRGALPTKMKELEIRYEIGKNNDGKMVMGKRKQFMKDTMGLISCVLGDSDIQRIVQAETIKPKNSSTTGDNKDGNSSLPYQDGTLIVEASLLQYQDIRTKCYQHAGIKMSAIQPIKACNDIKTPKVCGNSVDPQCKWRPANKKKGIEKACLPKGEYDQWVENSARKELEAERETALLIERIMPLECPKLKKDCTGNVPYEHCKWIDRKCRVDPEHQRYDVCNIKKMKDCKTDNECTWYGKTGGKNIGCVSRKRALGIQNSSQNNKESKSNEEPKNGNSVNVKNSINVKDSLSSQPPLSSKKYYPDLPTPEFPPDKRDARKKFDHCVKERSMFSYDKQSPRTDYNPTERFMQPKGLEARFAKIRSTYRQQSPKLSALMDAIQQQDKHDLETSGHLYKHVIYTDVKDSYYGVKLLTSIFMAEGYEIAKFSRTKSGAGQRKQTWSVILPTLTGEADKMKKSFVVLSSSGMSGPAFFAKDSIGYSASSALNADDKNLIKDAAFKAFNKRSRSADGNPGPNVYGQDVRFLLMDQGFKEGVDIFEARYMWILEPPASKASLTQAVGRVMRLCGSQGMPYKDWQVFITVLANRLPTKDEKLVYHLTVDDQQRASANIRLLFMKEGRNAAADKLLMESMHTTIQSGVPDPKRAIAKILQIP